MRKEMKIEEFADMARKSGVIAPALWHLAQIYKSQMPEDATMENNAMSCYLSGAHCALMLMGKLGHLTNKGMRLTEEFTDSLLQIIR